MDSNRYLITGGVGFVGSHLVKSFNSATANIFVADRRSSNESPILKEYGGFNSIEIDLRNATESAYLIREIKPDVIYHLAAQPLSQKSNHEPFLTMEDNVVATYSVLEGMRLHAPSSRFVFASSACFYGVPASPPPFREFDAPAVGHYIYTATKIAADFAVQHYRHVYGLDCCCVRLVNIYGPGETHLERIVPRLILRSLRHEAPTLTQSDGQDVLSFLYVDDVVKLLRLVGQSPHPPQVAVWNAEGCPPISIRELAKRIYVQCGTEPRPFATVGPRKGSPVHKYLDGTQVKAALNWTAGVTLDEGLRLTVEWYRDRLSTLISADSRHAYA